MVSEGELTRQASGTYGGFLTLMKWGTGISIAVGALVILLIAS